MRPATTSSTASPSDAPSPSTSHSLAPAMVVGSKLILGKILMRADTYYDYDPLAPTRDSKGRPLRGKPDASKPERKEAH